jgi:oxygen-independent coproporphyrinogen-3 oxidase
MYLATAEICGAAGMAAYEISNHARPGAESRHNLVYWRYGDYAGIGPGAHGRLTRHGTRCAIESLWSPEAWLEAVERQGTGTSLTSTVAPRDQAIEMLLMGLRLNEGVDPARFAALNGAPLSPERTQSLRDLDLLTPESDRLRATTAGRAVLDAVLRHLLAA